MPAQYMVRSDIAKQHPVVVAMMGDSCGGCSAESSPHGASWRAELEAQVLGAPARVEVGSDASEPKLLEDPKARNILGMNDRDEMIHFLASLRERKEPKGRFGRYAMPPGDRQVSVEQLDLFGSLEPLQPTISNDRVVTALDDRPRAQAGALDAIDMSEKGCLGVGPRDDASHEATRLRAGVEAEKSRKVGVDEWPNVQTLRSDDGPIEHGFTSAPIVGVQRPVTPCPGGPSSLEARIVSPPVARAASVAPLQPSRQPAVSVLIVTR